MHLDYLEIEISEFCNLNCRCCCDFSNLAKEKCFYAYEEYEKDLTRCAEIFSGIDKIRLMGGEPFLNPRIAEYARLAKTLFPDTDLRIVTNGTLLPRTELSLLRELGEIGAFLDISVYPPTKKLKKQINAKLKEAGLGFNFSPQIRMFFKPLLDKPHAGGKTAFENCLFTHCHMLGHGKLAPCSFAYCTYRLNEAFGTAYPEDDLIDIYSDVTAAEIIDRFSHPHAFCRHCAPALIPTKWRGGVTAEQAALADWTSNRDSLYVKALTVLQHAAKKPEMLLRKIVQKR